MKTDKGIAKIKNDFFGSENMTRIPISILQRSAVTQNALGGFIIHFSFENFP